MKMVLSFHISPDKVDVF